MILYRVGPPSAEGTVHFYRQKLVDSGLNLDCAIPVQALPFAYRSVANNSLSRISLRSSGVHTFAFVDGFLCFDDLFSAATAPGRTPFLFDSPADVAGQYRLTMGGAPGARSVNVRVTAEAGGRAKAFFLGVLQEDFPVHRLESTADTVLLVDSEVAIAAMAVALAVILVGSCVRYGWWDHWRASRGRPSEGPQRRLRRRLTPEGHAGQSFPTTPRSRWSPTPIPPARGVSR